MSIGCKMRSLGESTYFMRFLEPKVKELMGETPYKLDYVNGQRKVIIHTDRVDNEKLEAIKNAFIELETNVIIKEEQYNHHIEVSWRDINKYAECVIAEDLYNVNPAVNQNNEQSGNGYQFQDICSDGSIPYTFNKLSGIHPRLQCWLRKNNIR